MRAQPSTVLVTGGSGLVGSAVVPLLASRGFEVIATCRSPHGQLPEGAGIRWISWDGLERPLPDAPWNQISAVLHLAAPTNVHDYPARATELYELSVATTFRLLELARQTGFRLVVASTGDVLDGTVCPAREDSPYGPTSFYGASKAAAEMLVLGCTGVSAAIARLFHPYGPGAGRHLVARILDKIADGHEITIEGEDGIALNPVWTADLAQGLLGALESDCGGILHFAGPDLVTLRELLALAGEVVGRAPRVRQNDATPIQRHAASIERTCRVLGWKPKVGLSEGLALAWKSARAVGA